MHLRRAEKVSGGEYVEGVALEAKEAPEGSGQEWEETEQKYRVFGGDLLCRVRFGEGRRLHERSAEALKVAKEHQGR